MKTAEELFEIIKETLEGGLLPSEKADICKSHIYKYTYSITESYAKERVSEALEESCKHRKDFKRPKSKRH